MKEDLKLLQHAVDEIRILRQQNELMAGKLEVFEKCMKLFNAEPPRYGLANSQDIAWDIEKYLEKKKAEENQE